MKLDPQRIFAFRLGVRTLLLVPLLIAALVEDSLGADCLRDDRTVTFPDGSSRIRSYACKPANTALSEIDANYVIIPAGTSIEFEFELPPDLKDAIVRRSTLTIREYYEPYSHINIGADIASASSTRAEFMKSSIRKVSRGSGPGAPQP